MGGVAPLPAASKVRVGPSSVQVWALFSCLPEVLFQREQRPGGEPPVDLRVLGCEPGLGNPGFHPAVDAPLHGNI